MDKNIHKMTTKGLTMEQYKGILMTDHMNMCILSAPYSNEKKTNYLKHHEYADATKMASKSDIKTALNTKTTWEISQ